MLYENCPLFPLSAHLMPGGRMTLRIFEPRYVRMVKNACAQGTGFVVCMLNANGNKQDNTHIFSIGTYAEVVDFDVFDDGLLSITVLGKTAVSVGDITIESDGLRIANCETKPPWCCDVEEQDIEVMRLRLQEIFERYEELNTLYANPKFDDPIWVIHRWLELIPVDPEQKQYFISQQDCGTVLQFLKELVIE
jgi:Lon protease-like protein